MSSSIRPSSPASLPPPPKTDEEEPEMAEVCENLYEAAGKCETSHGFEDGIIDFISSLMARH